MFRVAGPEAGAVVAGVASGQSAVGGVTSAGVCGRGWDQRRDYGRRAPGRRADPRQAGTIVGTANIQLDDVVVKATGVTFDLELSSLVRRAGWIGQGAGDQPRVSFTSLFLAFFASQDPCSAWVQRTCEWTGLALADVVRHWRAHTPVGSLDEAHVRRAATLTDDQFARDPGRTDSAARMLLTQAVRLRTELGASGSLTTLHVLAAYVYDVTADHAADLVAWGLDRERRRSSRCGSPSATPPIKLASSASPGRPRPDDAGSLQRIDGAALRPCNMSAGRWTARYPGPWPIRRAACARSTSSTRRSYVSRRA